MTRSWPAALVAVLIVLIAIVLTVGGAWLAVLGGSLYYLIAGFLLLFSAWLLFRNRLMGVWVCCSLFLLSLLWGSTRLAATLGQ